MAQFRTLYSIPGGSIMMAPDLGEFRRYYRALKDLPETLMSIVMDVKIGAYVRGLATSHDLPVEASGQVALVVLEVVTGLLPSTEMSTTLEQRLEVEASVADSIAREIEKELLAPVALELNTFWQRQAGEVAGATAGESQPSGARDDVDSPVKPANDNDEGTSSVKPAHDNKERLANDNEEGASSVRPASGSEGDDSSNDDLAL